MGTRSQIAVLVSIVGLTAATLIAAGGCEFASGLSEIEFASGAAPGSGGTVSTDANGGAPSGGGGSMHVGAGGSGGVSACNVADDCPGQDTVCRTRACTQGVCGHTNAAQGVGCQGGGTCGGGNESGMCIGQQKGSACTQAIECTSGACVDSVCCETACTGLCKACSASKTGFGNGTCAFVSAQTDPDSECAQDVCDGAGLCRCQNQAKDGAETDVDCGGNICPSCAGAAACALGSDCATGNCIDSVCCDAPCTALCEACGGAKTGLADGTCGPVTAGTDPDSECQPDVCAGMPGSCRCGNSAQDGAETDVDCGGGVCPSCADGGHCLSAADCASSACVSGTCCPTVPCGPDQVPVPACGVALCWSHPGLPAGTKLYIGGTVDQPSQPDISTTGWQEFPGCQGTASASSMACPLGALQSGSSLYLNLFAYEPGFGWAYWCDQPGLPGSRCYGDVWLYENGQLVTDDATIPHFVDPPASPWSYVTNADSGRLNLKFFGVP